MTGSRYPDSPHIVHREKKIEISYNGVKLYMRISTKGNPMYAGMTKIRQDLEGRVIEETLGVRKRDIFKINRERNLSKEKEMQQVRNIISKYAYWFTEEETEKLEGLIIRYTNNRGRYKTNREPREHTGPQVNDPMTKERREQFRNIWKIVLNYNITEQEAARRLGYDDPYWTE